MSDYVDCPYCGSSDVKKVSFTWWGGYLGPSMLTHVKCRDCQATFNGKTGESNTRGIVIYSLVVGVVSIGLMILYFTWTLRK
jgi:transposase-like protein